MLNKKEMQELIPLVESWLDARWEDAMAYMPDRSEAIFYNGAVSALEILGFEWRRDENGKHTVY